MDPAAVCTAMAITNPLSVASVGFSHLHVESANPARESLRSRRGYCTAVSHRVLACNCRHDVRLDRPRQADHEFSATFCRPHRLRHTLDALGRSRRPAAGFDPVDVLIQAPVTPPMGNHNVGKEAQLRDGTAMLLRAKPVSCFVGGLDQVFPSRPRM